ncbi:hypothetical protein R1flu_019189 [Riccia fluitans]|uniref:Uncharacterized protein n=1 Tax=Riccia fluitans TaxID=41844 RepID=A0ABD1ZHY7_9MARC
MVQFTFLQTKTEMMFGIDTPARYFQRGSEGSRKEDNQHRKQEANEGAEDSDGPANDDGMTSIPIVDLENYSADLDRVRDAPLYGGFGVRITSKKKVKEEKAIDNLGDYCHLWD